MSCATEDGSTERSGTWNPAPALGRSACRPATLSRPEQCPRRSQWTVRLAQTDCRSGRHLEDMQHWSRTVDFASVFVSDYADLSFVPYCQNLTKPHHNIDRRAASLLPTIYPSLSRDGSRHFSFFCFPKRPHWVFGILFGSRTMPRLQDHHYEVDLELSGTKALLFVFLCRD